MSLDAAREWRISHANDGYWEIAHPGLSGVFRVADALGLMQGLRDALLREFPPPCDGKVGSDVGGDAARKERRERIATAVLGGLLSNPGNDGVRAPIMDYEPDLAMLCVRYADALIASLDEVTQ